MIHSYSLDKRVIPIGMVASLTHAMEQAGYSPEAVLAGTGLTLEDLSKHEWRVSYRQRIQQVENAINLVNDPGFWLRLPPNVSISDFGLLGYAMMSSATLEKAVQIAVKYHKMAGAMFELSFVEEGDEAVLRLDHMLAGSGINRFVVEDLFRGITPLIEILLGKTFKPVKIAFNYGPAVALSV